MLIMDARHPLTPLDEQLMAWLGDAPLQVLLSKADKLTRSEQGATLRAMQQRLGHDRVTLFSSVTRQGVEESRDLLEAWLENKRPPVKGK